MLNLSWLKCTNNTWCGLNTVDLASSHFNGLVGVYIIWHGGNKPRYVRVGQGEIRERLKCHREDKEIQTYKDLGLFVTWAVVNKNDLDGVENYLFNTLSPLVGERCPNCIPIQVNIP